MLCSELSLGAPISGDLRIDRTRLRSLLAARKADLCVRAMVWRAQEEAEARAQAQGVPEKDDMSDAEDEDENAEVEGEATVSMTDGAGRRQRQQRAPLSECGKAGHHRQG